VVEVKEIKLRPMIDDHDYEVKMRSMQSVSSRKATRSRSRCASWPRDGAPGARLPACSTASKEDVLKIAKVEQSRASKAGKS